MLKKYCFGKPFHDFFKGRVTLESCATSWRGERGMGNKHKHSFFIVFHGHLSREAMMEYQIHLGFSSSFAVASSSTFLNLLSSSRVSGRL